MKNKSMNVPTLIVSGGEPIAPWVMKLLFEAAFPETSNAKEEPGNDDIVNLFKTKRLAFA